MISVNRLEAFEPFFFLLMTQPKFGWNWLDIFRGDTA